MNANWFHAHVLLADQFDQFLEQVERIYRWNCWGNPIDISGCLQRSGRQTGRARGRRSARRARDVMRRTSRSRSPVECSRMVIMRGSLLSWAALCRSRRDKERRRSNAKRGDDFITHSGQGFLFARSAIHGRGGWFGLRAFAGGSGRAGPAASGTGLCSPDWRAVQVRRGLGLRGMDFSKTPIGGLLGRLEGIRHASRRLRWVREAYRAPGREGQTAPGEAGLVPRPGASQAYLAHTTASSSSAGGRPSPKLKSPPVTIA